MAEEKGSLVRIVWVTSVFALVTVGLSIFVLALTPLRLVSPSFAHRVARLWARLILRSMGIGFNVEGLENLPPEGGYVLAVNHRSALDIPILLAGLPLDFRWLAKESLFRIPLMGWSMKKIGYVPIHRSESVKAMRLLIKAAARIKEGLILVVFPEGTRSPDEETMLPFKMGSFVMALKAARPVVPVGLAGSGRLLPPKSRRPRRGQVAVKIGPPLDCKKFSRKDAPGLAEATRRAILNLLDSGEEAA